MRALNSALLNKSDERARFLRYCIVGVVTAGIYSGMIFTSVVIPIVRPEIATAVVTVVAGAFNFAAHRYFTFIGSRPFGTSVLRYLTLLTINAVLGAAIVAVATLFGASIVTANLLVVALVTISTYFVLDLLVI